MRKKPNLPERIAKCGDLYIQDPARFRGGWQQQFPQFRDKYLEIGCGRGRFTTETALKMPDILLIAVERVPEAMIIGLERAAREQIPNVRFLDTDAATLPDIFGDGEVGRIYINFCDPWPKAGNRKRRLTHENFLVIYESVLRVGGEIHFKTDNRDLFEFSLGQFEKAGFELSEVTTNLHQNGPVGIMTDYEEKFYSEGVSICRCVAKLSEKAHRFGERPGAPDIMGSDIEKRREQE
ncbi:tRNA (guanosine(46)-N7)-methyltransferase TrmB [Oscillospiraceae bacterium CM]|nr:tRNA (guanosine(46)-N7)-methyltransferase TrmB [Oscillospiraceae bacterium CM]